MNARVLPTYRRIYKSGETGEVFKRFLIREWFILGVL
jgi:hypothetical protein